jgi:hypothetical protein
MKSQRIVFLSENSQVMAKFYAKLQAPYLHSSRHVAHYRFTSIVGLTVYHKYFKADIKHSSQNVTINFSYAITAKRGEKEREREKSPVKLSNSSNARSQVHTLDMRTSLS